METVYLRAVYNRVIPMTSLPASQNAQNDDYTAFDNRRSIQKFVHHEFKAAFHHPEDFKQLLKPREERESEEERVKAD